MNFISQEEQKLNNKSFNVKEKQIDIVELSSNFFEESKPLGGIARELLSEALLKTSKNEPTLPGRF